MMQNGLFSPLARDAWPEDLIILRPGSIEELRHGVIARVWDAKLLHVVTDRLSLSAEAMHAVYDDLLRELHVVLNENARTRQWGEHPQESWLKVVTRSVVEGRDHARPLHTDEAGRARPVDLNLMYSVHSAASGGANVFVPSRVVWQRLLQTDAQLAWNLTALPVTFEVDGAATTMPIIRRHDDSVFINWNRSLIRSGQEPQAEKLVMAFDRFLEALSPQDFVEVALGSGDAMIWWDELMLHARAAAVAGAEQRVYMKSGVEVSPSPIRSRRPGVQPAAVSQTYRLDDEYSFLPELANAVLARKATNRPLLVAIDGPAAAGKTSLMRRLSQHLDQRGVPTQWVSVDDFIFKKRQRYAAGVGGEAFLHSYCDYERLRTDVLEPIKNNGRLKASLTLLDENTDEYSIVRDYDVTESTVVLCEGVFLMREELSHLFDFVIYLDISPYMSLARGVIRKGTSTFRKTVSRFYDTYLPGEAVYQHSVRSLREIDVLINCDSSPTRAAVADASKEGSA